MSLIKISHAKDTIGLLEAGYSTHVPIAYTSIKVSEMGATEIINIKGKNLGSVFKSQATFEIEFRGLVPISLNLNNDLNFQNTHQLLTAIAGHSIPVSMVVAQINTHDRRFVNLDDLFRPRAQSIADREPTNPTDVLFIASGFLDQAHVLSEAGKYIEIKSVLRADEVYIGGNPAAHTKGLLSKSKLWSYLS